MVEAPGFLSSGYVCPRCQSDDFRNVGEIESDSDRENERWEREEQYGEQLEQIVKRQEEAAYRAANPGEFECPECKYVSLRRDASRCPVCHATVGRDHWSLIYERERFEAQERARREKLAAAEWAAGEPERQRQRVEAQRLAKAEATAAIWRIYLKFYFQYLLPVLCIGTVNLIFGPRSWGYYILMVIPWVNWLTVVALLFFAGPIMWISLALWGGIGALIYRATTSVS
jgi:hypothetical protein